MSPLLLRCQHLDLANLSADQIGMLAVAIRQLADGGSLAHLSQALDGCNFGLLRGSGTGREMALCESAAVALGARVACLEPGLTGPGTPLDLAHTAHVIGRLYDALVCVGSAGARLRRIGVLAGVPLIEGFAASRQRLERLAGLVGGPTGEDDHLRLVVQAVFLHALA